MAAQLAPGFQQQTLCPHPHCSTQSLSMSTARPWMRSAAHRSSMACRAEHEKVKKRRAFGEWLLETDDPSVLDQPPEKDFWEGPQWDIIGKSAGFAVPIVVVLAVLVGLFAAGGYNSGNTAVLKPPTSPEDTAQILPNPEMRQTDHQ